MREMLIAASFFVIVAEGCFWLKIHGCLSSRAYTLMLHFFFSFLKGNRRLYVKVSLLSPSKIANLCK